MNNELELFKQAAINHFGSQEQGEAFVDGFLKQAADPTVGIKEGLTFFGSVGKGLGEGVGKGIAAGAAGLAFAGIAGVVGNMLSQSEKAKLHVKFQSALDRVKNSNRIVKGAEVSKVNSYAETIFRFAPHVSTDPNLLGSLLSNFIQGESIDPMSIKMLTELEGRYADNSKFQFTKV